MQENESEGVCDLSDRLVDCLNTHAVLIQFLLIH